MADGRPDPAAHAFQVDLRGVVDLFARHLYSSPRVYVRELLQNGVDAITARRDLDPAAPAQVRIVPIEGGGIEIRDTGIGLTYDEAGDFLATIGRSSKREESLTEARGQYLGQFGIGLLSAFMVAEEIEMFSLSARQPDATGIRWRGLANGSYTLETLDRAAYAEATGRPEGEPGSLVRLVPRRDQEHWLAPATVAALAEDFGSLLPIDVAVEVTLDDGERLWRRISSPELPWQRQFDSPGERQVALARYCERALGFTPLAALDLELPVAGLSGAAFILPTATSPSGQSTHRVYLKRMLIGAHVADLLPDWAFFVRCVVDSTSLRPTASREALYEDDILLATREALGQAVLRWTIEVLSSSSPLQQDFVRTHHLAIRALALHDDTMLDLASQVLPYETTDGPRTLAEFATEYGQVRYTTTVEDFRRVAPVARAQGLGVVNGGYVYDSDLLARLADRKPAWDMRPLEARDIEQTLTELEPEQELAFLDYLAVAREALASVDCEPVVRSFSPADIPAMFVTDRDIEHQRSLERTKEEVSGIWAEVLDGFSQTAAPRRLVLNHDNETVQALAAGHDSEVQGAGTRSLYVTAQLLAGEPLRAQEAALMNDALGTLLRRALPRQ